jgi:hypothetical protein
MDIFYVRDRLLYDSDKFNIYLDFRKSVKDSKYLSFEEFLLCSNYLDLYIQNPEDTYEKYIAYHEDEAITESDCFEIFCQTFNVSPYDNKVLDEYRACKNCINYVPTKSLITGDEYYACRGEFVPCEDDVCEYHNFNPEKAKNIIRILRK